MDKINFLLEILVCFLLSSCIGIERQYRRRSVGLRTVILVSLGAFLFCNFSYAYPNSDMNRIAAQVVAGIGFLGAGVIIKDEKSVKGLTTAATLWCAAAIGVLCAANLLFEAAIGTFLILFTNIVLRTVNSKINKLSGNINYNVYYYTIICEEKNEKKLIKIIKDILKENNANIKSIEIVEQEDGNIKISLCIISNNEKDNINSMIMKTLSEREDVMTISLNKKDTHYLYEEEEL